MRLIWLTVVLVLLVIQQCRAQADVAPPVHFIKTWCPTQSQRDALSEHLILEMDGCCIQRGIPRSEQGVAAGALSRWKTYIMSDKPYPPGTCQGTNDELEAPKAAVRAEAERQAAIEETARRAARDSENLKVVPGLLRQMSHDQFCVAFGPALRSDYVEGAGTVKGAAAMARTEARRRGVAFNERMVVEEQIRLGQSRCQLLAALGEPNGQNRSVGPWGLHIQHVYGSNTFVYTENGVITSYQD